MKIRAFEALGGNLGGFSISSYKMKKAIVAAIAVAFFVSTAAEARGGRGFSGGRSFSRPAPAKTYAPKRTTVVKKNTTVVNQTVHQNTTSSSGGGFWSTVMGAAAGSMAGNAIYDAVTKDDEPKQPAQAQQPQVVYVPVGSDGKPVQQAQ